MKALPGKALPKGATWDGKGVNFSLFSRNAEKVELCLFDSPEAKQESTRIVLSEKTHHIWHGYLPGIWPGQLYGYRVHGPSDPNHGLRFNANKLLLDPYAKAVAREIQMCDEMFGYQIGHPDGDLSFDGRDNAHIAPLSAVIDSADFNWAGDAPPRIPWNRTVIYELHVGAFTKLNPLVPPELRGTFAGLASEPVLRYLKELGVTAVELLPIHLFASERSLLEKGLKNYWGYNSIAFFAPHSGYSSASSPAGVVREFKQMVKKFHEAGLEIILDVVYNHTAEGNEWGPTLSLRGIDNPSYYRLPRNSRRHYENFTGCGNTLRVHQPRTLQLIMDSLRYWIRDMRVDGFRFDLASSLARGERDVSRASSFFHAIQQDPVISEVKLIAEPWDLGPDGFQLGNFPAGWAEWNSRFRDTIRSFWKGDVVATADFATRFSGSSDLFGYGGGRGPQASLNYVTCHDGFSLQDLVSYNHKHNEANQEDNRDGEDRNLSWNCGAEGPTENLKVKELRRRQKRNLIAALLLSQGAPMIRSGDEMSHAQKGNNNAYCQDNELNWLNWNLDDEANEFLNFVRNMIRFRSAQPALRRKNFLEGKPIPGSTAKDIAWFDAKGNEMSEDAWKTPSAPCLGIRLDGAASDERDEEGRPVTGETLLILMNALQKAVVFTAPQAVSSEEEAWEIVLDTARKQKEGSIFISRSHCKAEAHSLIIFKRIQVPLSQFE